MLKPDADTADECSALRIDSIIQPVVDVLLVLCADIRVEAIVFCDGEQVLRCEINPYARHGQTLQQVVWQPVTNLQVAQAQVRSIFHEPV